MASSFETQVEAPQAYPGENPCISAIRAAIKPSLPIPAINEVVYDPTYRATRVEARTRDGSGSFGYARIGDLVVLDDRLRGEVLQKTPNLCRGNILYLSSFESDFAQLAHILYASATISALSAVDLTGKHLLDLGSADGLLGLVGKKYGAKKVTSVEMYPEKEALYQRHIQANGFSPADFSFVACDLTDTQKLLPQIDTSDIDVVVCNIGPWYKNAADQHAAALLSHLERATTFVGGGFAYESGDLGAGKTIERCHEAGFNGVILDYTLRKGMGVYHAFTIYKSEPTTATAQ